MKRFLKFLLKFFLFLFFCILLLSTYIFFTYRNWERKFEEEIQSKGYITRESIKEISLDERLAQFVVSSSDTEFLELKTEEFGAILFTVLDSYLKEDISISKIYIETEKSQWRIYLKTEYEDIGVWLSMDLNKDDMQTAQLYTKEIYVGPFPIHNFTNWEETINRGIADAIVTLNENGFVGRYIENIELLEDGIILKGSRY
jgi:hypothetical protein